MRRLQRCRRGFAAAAFTVLIVQVAVPHLPAYLVPGPEPLPPRTVVVRRSGHGALERSPDGGHSWSPVTGLPTRVLPADRSGETLPVSAFAAAPAAPSNPVARSAIARSPGLKAPGYVVVIGPAPVLAAVGNRLFVSRDGLVNWSDIELEGVTNASTYVTALAIDPEDHDHWLVGTSYDGIYRTLDGGESWDELTANRERWPIYVGAGFFEEIAGIWFTAFDYVVIQAGFGQGFLTIELDPLVIRRLAPFAGGANSYEAIGRIIGAQGPEVTMEVPNNDAPGEAARRAEERRSTAADRTGIYLSPNNAVTERLPGYFDYMERHGFNSVVVDFKDDLGRLTYASSLEKPRAAGAVVPIIDPVELIAAARDRGFYLIARVVVFQDPRLYAYDNYRYALWDRVHDRPWAVYRTHTDGETGVRRTVRVEHWVDAYSGDVWDYNIDIAREIAALGVDEIQFDYIRFPSDGNTSDIHARYAVEGADRVQALEGFLSAAREAIDIPIGIDVFGFNAWAHMNYLGQDVNRLADYVDVISPMFYPSHFARSFLPQFSYLDRASVIYDQGTRRAHALANRGSQRSESGRTGTIIRPYVQAFLIGAELEYEQPTYTHYLRLQVDASLAGGASGYTLWNASGRYYMLP